MKIIEQNSTTLILKDYAGRIWLVGVFILAIAGATFTGLADSYTTNQDKVNEYSTTLVLLFSLIGLVIGGCIIYEHPLVCIKFNKILKEAAVYRKGFMRNETETYRLNEIEDIVIIESEGSEGDIFYNVAAKLKGDGQILLSAAGECSNECQRKNAEIIKRFLREG